MYDQLIFDIFISCLAAFLVALTLIFSICIIRSINYYKEYFLKAVVYFATIVSSLLLMTFVMSIVGLIMMGLYSFGSLLFTGQVDGLTALYIGIDTAFILGGGLSVITGLLCYPDIYDYFRQLILGDSDLLNQIAKDPLQPKIINIDINKRHLLNELVEEDNPDYSCPICLDSLLLSGKNVIAQESIITLRNSESKDNGEQSYHKDCLLSWMKTGEGTIDQDPVMRIKFTDPRLFQHFGYKRKLRDKLQNIDTSANNSIIKSVNK